MASDKFCQEPPAKAGGVVSMTNNCTTMSKWFLSPENALVFGNLSPAKLASILDNLRVVDMTTQGVAQVMLGNRLYSSYMLKPEVSAQAVSDI